MSDEHGTERRGAQLVNSAEREAKNNPANQQDLTKPPQGRDEPPASTPVEKPERDPDSPWMGGG